MKSRSVLPGILKFVAVVAALGIFGSYVYFQHQRYGNAPAPVGPAVVDAPWIEVPAQLISDEGGEPIFESGNRFVWLEEPMTGVAFAEIPPEPLPEIPLDFPPRIDVMAAGSKSGGVFLPDEEISIMAASSKSGAVAIGHSGVIRATGAESVGGRIVLHSGGGDDPFGGGGAAFEDPEAGAAPEFDDPEIDPADYPFVAPGESSPTEFGAIDGNSIDELLAVSPDSAIFAAGGSKSGSVISTGSRIFLSAPGSEAPPVMAPSSKVTVVAGWKPEHAEIIWAEGAEVAAPRQAAAESGSIDLETALRLAEPEE